MSWSLYGQGRRPEEIGVPCNTPLAAYISSSNMPGCKKFVQGHTSELDATYNGAEVHQKNPSIPTIPCSIRFRVQMFFWMDPSAVSKELCKLEIAGVKLDQVELHFNTVDLLSKI